MSHHNPESFAVVDCDVEECLTREQIASCMMDEAYERLGLALDGDDRRELSAARSLISCLEATSPAPKRTLRLPIQVPSQVRISLRRPVDTLDLILEIDGKEAWL